MAAEIAEVAYAGTLVGALLQTAAFITQAEILESFKTFFQSGGALIYTIGAIAAVISVTIFGSYRCGRYFLLGPAIFFFLIGPRAETQGVIWKLGDGKPRTIQGSTDSLEEAVTYAQSTVFETRDPEGSAGWAPGEPIRVAWFFKWFTDLIDYFVHESTKVILSHEDDEDLLFISRHRAFEAVVNAQADNPELLSMFEDNLSRGCQPMLQASLALANPALDSDEINSLYRNGRGDSADHAANTAAMYQEIYNKTKQHPMQPNQATVDYMLRNETRPSVAKAIADFKASRAPISPDASFKDLQHDFTMTCGDMWAITQDAFLDNAQQFYDKLKETYAGDFRELDDVERNLGSALAKKLGQEDPFGGMRTPNDDDVVRGIGLYMIKNAVNARAMGRIQQHHLNWQSAVDPVPAGSILILDSNNDPKILRRGKDPFELELHGDSWVARVKQPIGEDRFHFFTPLLAVGDHQDTAFTDSLQYQTQGMKQGIFSIAMNVPYYQGVLLYLVGISYPFLALIVLIPTKAQAFLYVPLTWLWLRSWEIGFALVRVLDKVLWAMLPNSDLSFDVFNGELPNVLHEALKGDPLYNLYSYYYLVSFALGCIPAVSAYCTIKAKQAVLSSFTEALGKEETMGQNLGEGSWGLQQMNRRKQAMDALSGVAQLRHVTNHNFQKDTAAFLQNFAKEGIAGGLTAAGMGMLANGIEGGIANWGTLGDEVKKAVSNPGSYLKGNFNSIVDGAAGAGSNGLDGMQRMVAAKFAERAAHDKWFDPVIGRASEIQRMYNAAGASQDSEGGFEVDSSDFYEAHNARIEFEAAVLGFMAENTGSIVSGVAGGFGTRGANKRNAQAREARKAARTARRTGSPLPAPPPESVSDRALRTAGRIFGYGPGGLNTISWLSGHSPTNLLGRDEAVERYRTGADEEEFPRPERQLAEDLDLKIDPIQTTYPKVPPGGASYLRPNPDAFGGPEPEGEE